MYIARRTLVNSKQQRKYANGILTGMTRKIEVSSKMEGKTRQPDACA